jgi:hypothetical protein
LLWVTIADSILVLRSAVFVFAKHDRLNGYNKRGWLRNIAGGVRPTYMPGTQTRGEAVDHSGGRLVWITSYCSFL